MNLENMIDNNLREGETILQGAILRPLYLRVGCDARYKQPASVGRFVSKMTVIDRPMTDDPSKPQPVRIPATLGTRLWRIRRRSEMKK